MLSAFKEWIVLQIQMQTIRFNDIFTLKGLLMFEEINDALNQNLASQKMLKVK